MKLKNLLLPLASLAVTAHAATVIPAADVYGHNEKNNYDGNINDMIIGSGMNGYNYDTAAPPAGWPAGEGDPSTWTATGSGYQDEWQSQDLLDAGESPTNGKIGWTAIDLGGSTAGLENLYLWHVRENNGRYAASYNVYVADSPTVALAHGPTNGTSIDYDFSTGGWTQIGATRSGTYQGAEVVSLGGITGRYIGLEILANNGDGSRVGFAEVAVTQVPEPAGLVLLGLGGLALLRRRR